MLKKLVVILALLSPILYPVNAIASEDYLLSADMNQSLTWDSSDLVPSEAQLKQVRFRIPRSNPDTLIAQIVLKYPLSSKSTILDTKWILGLWLYAPTILCQNQYTCDYILEIGPGNDNQSYIYKHTNKINFETRVKSDCKAPWYLEKNDNGDSMVSFELSITCLNISSTFVSYAFSSYDLGLTPRPWHFTAQNFIENKYQSLAEKAYFANGGKNGLGKITGSPELEDFKTSVESAREVFDSMMDRYQTLAIETQKKIDKKIEWKNFLKSEDELLEIEDSLDTFTFSTNADKLIATVALQKLISLKTKALQLQLTVIPQYQCYNEPKDLTKALGKSKSCPKGYKKVKT